MITLWGAVKEKMEQVGILSQLAEHFDMEYIWTFVCIRNLYSPHLVGSFWSESTFFFTDISYRVQLQFLVLMSWSWAGVFEHLWKFNYICKIVTFPDTLPQPGPLSFFLWQMQHFCNTLSTLEAYQMFIQMMTHLLWRILESNIVTFSAKILAK